MVEEKEGESEGEIQKKILPLKATKAGNKGTSKENGNRRHITT